MSTLTIPALIPLSLLEALRNIDAPVEDGLEELAGEVVSKRLGLSTTVQAQIARYAWHAQRRNAVPLDEATSVFRLVGRRPDAPLIFADAGRRAARKAARRWPGALGLLPARAGRGLGVRAAGRVARRVVGGHLTVKDAAAVGAVPLPLGLDAVPEGTGCGFYGAFFGELLRGLARFEGAVRHTRCRSRGDERCEWRASAVGGYR
ncbi:MAG TPA: hypothetical protein VFI13_02825 [Gemmatimonadales bacterium]|nr:hypothetical protein [Gemmatimonadales bacterium]